MKANWSEDLKYNFKVLDPNKITLDKAIEEFGEDTEEYNKCIFALETIDRCLEKHSIQENNIISIDVDIENMERAKLYNLFPINYYAKPYPTEELLLLLDLSNYIDISKFTSFSPYDPDHELKDIIIYKGDAV